jgi:dolichol-phosphate mannosyltransferase
MEKLRSFDVVIGSRYVHGGQVENWSTARRILSRAANLYSRCLTGLPVKDTTSGYMGIRTEVLAKADLTKVRSLGFAYLMEFKKALFEVTDKVVEVPIDFVERRQGSSKFGWKIFMEGLVYPWKVFMTRILRTLDF